MNDNVQSEIDLIEHLKGIHQGSAFYEDKEIDVEIEKVNDRYLFRLGGVWDLDANEISFDFVSQNLQLKVFSHAIANRFSVNAKEKWGLQYLEGRIESFTNYLWDSDKPNRFRSYYHSNGENLLFGICDKSFELSLLICDIHITLHDYDGYIIIENVEKIDENLFSQVCYNILVALGFISGKFIQNEVYTFQDINYEHRNDEIAYKYRKLRPSFTSMFPAVTANPFGYKHLIGSEFAQNLYENNTLKYLDETSLSKLAELSLNNSQIQYALVLFNEANGNGLSLLIKNNCFFAVLEVLKKYFHDIFKVDLPKEYSQKGNVEKFALIFSRLISLTSEELEVIEKRNVFLHGDIKHLGGKEMVAIMQKQITLIYKVLLTYVGFDGYIIDHYFLRNNNPEKAFVKLN